MAGLNEFGFTRKTLTEIVDSLKQRGKDEFGTNFNTNDDSVFSQLVGVIALEMDEAWQSLEGAYSAYTYNGAEGIYLDDLFSRHNIIRLPATAGTGTVYIESDNTTVVPQPVPVLNGYSFPASNNITYDLSSDVTIDVTSTSAYKIVSDDIDTGTSYTIYCVDDLAVVQSTVISGADKGAFVTAVKAFVDATNTSTAGKTFDFPTVGEEEFYLGFDANKLLTPLDTEIEFYTVPPIGNRYSVAPVTASEAGYNPLPSNGIKDMTPKFDGFVGASNVTAFASGTNVETDPEFRARFNRLIDASATGSDRASIESAVLGVDDVKSVRIYENPTDTPTAEVDTAYAYNTVVFGGDPVEISDVIFANGPVNVLTAGTDSFNKTALSGDIIVVKFTPADAVSLRIEVTYGTLSGSDLTQFEQDEIAAALDDLSLNFEVGTTVYNIQLNSAVISSLDYGRLTSLVVKTTTTHPTGYTTNDFATNFAEYPQLSTSDITYVKVP